MSDQELIKALREECEDCSERGATDKKCHSLYYCPNRDAADRIEVLLSEVAAMKQSEDRLIHSRKTVVDQLAELRRREADAMKTVNLMAEYIVTKGRVDYFLCDEIPKSLHLKYQPKNDGNYENRYCAACVAEYFMRGQQGAGEE